MIKKKEVPNVDKSLNFLGKVKCILKAHQQKEQNFNAKTLKKKSDFWR